VTRGKHYGHLARDGREHAIRLLDNYTDIEAADVQALDVRWTPQLPIVRTRSLELPGEVPEHGNAFAIDGDAVHGQLGRADHEVDVLGALVGALAVLVLDEEREAVAERDVAR
jgi:hypothetical protein